MKSIHLTVVFYLLAFAFSPTFLSAQQPGVSAAIAGFTDRNQDGINDRFTDADGNGINDVTGTAYPHTFRFIDQDGDGVNDVWRDADGDGVNDLLGEIQKRQMQWIDRDGDGIMDEEAGNLRGRALRVHVLDVDQDGKNDITGFVYTGRELGGYRYGFVDEENGISDSAFMDADGDGMNDRFADRDKGHGQGRPHIDVFIDEDGDGIADDRGLGRLRGRGKKKGKK